MSPEIADGQHGTNKLQTAENAVQNLSLWKIEETVLELSDICSDSSISEEEREPARKALAEWVQAEISKVDRVRSFLRHCEVMEAAAKEEANIQRARAQRWGDRAAALKQACIVALETAGKKSVEGRTGKLSVRGNGGKAPLELYDQSQIPNKYEVVTVDVDRNKIREDLERGEKVPGARLLDRGTHLHVT